MQQPTDDDVLDAIALARAYTAGDMRGAQSIIDAGSHDGIMTAAAVIIAGLIRGIAITDAADPDDLFARLREHFSEDGTT